MTPTIATPSPSFTELAAVLAEGWLRLTRLSQKRADSGDKELDLPATESPDRVHDGDHQCRTRPA